MTRIVQPVLRIDDSQAPADADAHQRAGRPVPGLETRDVVDGVEHRVAHVDRLQGMVGKDRCHFPAERPVPFHRGAPGRGQQEPAPLDVLAEAFPLAVRKPEGAFAGHDQQGKLVDLLAGQLDCVEPAAGRNGRFLLRLDQEMIRKAAAALGPRVDQVGHLDNAVGLAPRLPGVGHHGRPGGKRRLLRALVRRRLARGVVLLRRFGAARNGKDHQPNEDHHAASPAWPASGTGALVSDPIHVDTYLSPSSSVIRRKYCPTRRR